MGRLEKHNEHEDGITEMSAIQEGFNGLDDDVLEDESAPFRPSSLHFIPPFFPVYQMGWCLVWPGDD